MPAPKKKITKTKPKKVAKAKIKPKEVPLPKMAVGDFKFYIYMPKSFLKSRLDPDTNTIHVSNYRDIDSQGRGVSETLAGCVRLLAANKTYAKCLDELTICEVTVTNKYIVGTFMPSLMGVYQNTGIELIFIKEIDFKKYLMLA